MNSIKIVNAPLSDQIVKDIHDQMEACVIRLKQKKVCKNSDVKKQFILTLCAEQMLKFGGTTV